MNQAFLQSGTILIPIAAVWLSYPRRSRVAGACSGLSLVVSALLIAFSPEQTLLGAALAAIGSLFASITAWFLCRRREADHRVAAARLETVRAQRLRISEELTRLKKRGASAEREHRETLAVYGMVKSLAEALSWDDARPRIEGAIEQYFGNGAEYALYVSGLRDEGEVRPLTLRGLKTSPGATWTTLNRFLQEQGAAATAAKVFERPERAVGMPIHEGNEMLGYLYARVPEGTAPQDWLSKTEAFASELIVAFKRVKLFQEMGSVSEVDGLTGLKRRGTFDKRLAEETVRAKTFKTTFGLMLLDIDHFKSLNDKYGHPFGDQVLKRVGTVLGTTVYDTDFVARYGGEEFVVLLPRAEPEGALRKAEAIRAAIEAEAFPVGFEVVKTTISIGLAFFPRDASTPEELVARADAAMYAAKSGGRNRVVDCDVLRSR